MVDYSKELVEKLKTVLPTYYELALTSKTKTPCISYMEYSNSVEVNGKTLGYSKVSYTVKVWSNKVADLHKYSQEVDKVLTPLGFRRLSSTELADNNSAMIQKVMVYEALMWEEF